ncbi:MAG: RnfH family protein [Neisseriaceae bacterium]
MQTKQNNSTINIELAFAAPNKQIIIPLCIPSDTTIDKIIANSDLHLIFPEFDFSDISKLQIGIFGKKIDSSTYQLKEYDRIEIYRPLNKTPNQKRLERAKLDKKE